MEPSQLRLVEAATEDSYGACSEAAAPAIEASETSPLTAGLPSDT